MEGGTILAPRVEQLTPRERREARRLDILAAVLDHRYLTAELLRVLFPPDPEAQARGTEIRRRAAAAETAARRPSGPNDYMTRELRSLASDGFLVTPQAARSVRNAPAVFCLTYRGARRLLDEGRAAPEDVRTRMTKSATAGSWGPIDHELANAQVHAALLTACERRGLSVLWVRYPRRTAELRFELPGRGPRLEPDGYVVIETEEGGRRRRLHNFIEVERSTGPTGMKARYARYVTLFKLLAAASRTSPGSLFPEPERDPNPVTQLYRVVTYAKSVSYRESLRAAAAEIGTDWGGMFFAHLAEVNPETVLGPLYRTPRGQEVVGLL